MLSIEEYIAKRKKEDRINEFDLKLRDKNLRKCSDYVFEYFTNYLKSLESLMQIHELKEKAKNQANNQIELLTVKEVCDILKISRWVVTKLVENGQLKASKIGKMYRFKQEDIALLVLDSTVKVGK